MYSLKNGLKFLALTTALVTPAFVYAQSAFANPVTADAEYHANWGLDMINALPAYQKGFTGKGVIVAVVDSGLTVNHPEYLGRVSPLHYNFGDSQALDDVSPTRNPDGSFDAHGDHVAGIIGAGRNGFGMQGVAYESILMPLRAIGVGSRDVDVLAENQAIIYAANHGAQVLNGSYGPYAFPKPYIDGQPNPNYQVLDYQLIASNPYYYEQTYKALKYAAEKDVVMVFAAGNERQDQPGYYTSLPSGNGMFPLITPDFIRSGKIRFIDYDNPGLNLDDPSTYTFLDPADPDVDDIDFSDLKGSLIAVVSVGRDGSLAPYSNECGETAEWCLAAPGGVTKYSNDPDGIYSTWPHGDPTNDNQEYQYLQGTSMASPHVAGAAAVVRSAFPYLNARQTIETILTTATKEGFEDEAKFGQGLLNLGAAVDGPMAFRYTGVFDVDTKGYSSIWSNSISGIGDLTKRGEGILVLEGNNSYQGGTNIVGGVLEVNGSITSPTDVSEAGMIAGLGAVGELTLSDGGKVAPGSAFNPENAIGTLTVNGTFTQQAGSTYLADLVSGNGPNAGVDQIVVDGTAGLQDGSSLELAYKGFTSGAQASSRSVLLSATNGVNGTYGDIAGSYVKDARFINFALDYDANNVFLDTSRSDVAFADVANSQNQSSTAVALETQGSGGTLYDHILFLTQQDVREAYDQLSGEAYASIQSTFINNSAYTRSAVYSNLSQAFASASAEGSQSSENWRLPTIWGHGFGDWTNLSGDGNAARSKSSIGGFISGIDAQVFDNWRFGVLASYSQTNFRLNERMSSGKSDDYTIGTYGGTEVAASQGTLAFRTGLAYTWHNIDMNRSVAFTGFVDKLSADYKAGTFQIFGELGYKHQATEQYAVEPYANLAYVHLRTDAFTETDRNGAALNVHKNTMDTALSSLGFRVTADLNQDIMPVKVHSDIAWRHAFGDITPVSKAHFSGSSGFAVSGNSIARNTVSFSGGLDFQIKQNAVLGVSYQGQFGSGITQNGVNANLRVKF